MRHDQMVATIKACVPGFEVHQSRKIVTGWEYDILDVNNKFIFRFPRYRGSWPRLLKEASLLASISDSLQIETPRYEFVWKGSKAYPKRFGAYRKIPGTPCTFDNFRKRWSARLGKDLGRFLTELHSLARNYSTKKIPEFSPHKWAESSRRYLLGVRKYAYPSLTDKQKIQCERLWSMLLRDIENSGFNPSLIHGDLTDGNIPIDGLTGRLTGVVDWGDALYADPAFDFVGAYEISKSLCSRALEAYRLPKSGFARRIQLYALSIPFGEIAWGAKQRSERYTRIGTRHLAKLGPKIDNLFPAEAQ